MNKKDIFVILSVIIFVGFLFSIFSSAQSVTLYYNNATADGDWNTLANWWTDDTFIMPASSLPASGDNVIVSVSVFSNSGPDASVNTMTVNGSTSILIPVTVASGATFNDNSVNFDTISGDTTFNDGSHTAGTSIISGDAIFNDSSFNVGIISGDATFNDLSYNHIDCDAFPCVVGIVSGNATFNDSSINKGTVSGDAVFNVSSYNTGTVSGDATFNDSSYNNGTVSSDATFNDDSYNDFGGAVLGNTVFNNSSFNNGGIAGNAIFNNSSFNASSVDTNATFNDSSLNEGIVSGNAIFNDSSLNNGSVDIDAIFNDSSKNDLGTVFGNASFYDSTINEATVIGDACFALTADPDGGTVGGTITVCDVSLPTVTTNPATIPSSSSAHLFGTITDTGGESTDPAGFEYGRTTSYGSTVTLAGPFVRETFDSIVTSLNDCGPYHYRAFATNSAGTGYGNDVTFTFKACGSAGGRTTPPPPTCTYPQVLVNGFCTTPPPPTCTSTQILVNNVCVERTSPPVPPPAPKPIPPPVPPAPVTPPPTSTLPPTSDTTAPPSSSSTESENVFGSVLGAVREFINNSSVKLVANVAIIVPIVASLVVVGAALLAGMPLANYLFYLFIIFSQILGFAKKPKPWGTVYDSVTKRPLPFVRVEIFNEQSRKLQSTVTDANGRYGFLISPELTNIQIRAYLAKYDFPSKEHPSVIEQKMYPNIYKGGFIGATGSSINLDLPMDPRDKTLAHNFYFGISSIKLNNVLASAANVLFVVGATFGLANAIINPSAISYSILALIFLTFLVRTSGFKLKPFGLTKDTHTNKTLPFGFITLHNQGGERTNFTVSDDQGRYFMLTPKGNYTLKAFTPSHISPTRTKELSISTKKGWISREVLL